jgi:membrane protein implicated in regulation of membrane protease activity
MLMRRKLLFWGPLGIVGLLLFLALGGFIVQWLWNTLLPPLFGLPVVTFWQALGLLALSRILFGGVGGSHRARRSGHSRIRHHVADRVVDRVAARMETMTPEERARVRHAMRERFGFDADDDPAGSSR